MHLPRGRVIIAENIARTSLRRPTDRRPIAIAWGVVVVILLVAYWL